MGGCSASLQPVPRLERYDFSRQTPIDLVRLRQIATGEGPESDIARYAMARAHADWLFLGLVQSSRDDVLLRQLAVDLGIEGASVDDTLSLPQILEAVRLVSEEARAASAAGGEARRWSSDIVTLLEGVSEGWESFGPSLFEAVHEVSQEEGPARLSADLLALGWARIVLVASANQSSSERPAFIARMASYYDPRVSEAFASGGRGFHDEGLAPRCEAAEDAESMHDQLAESRRACRGERLGFSYPVGESLSTELIVLTSLLRDLLERRRRIDRFSQDPLRIAAAGVIDEFDAVINEVRVPLPLAIPGPRYGDVPRLAVNGGTWRSAATVVTVGGGESSPVVSLWPTLGVVDGEVQLLDRLEAAQSESTGELSARLRERFAEANERLGVEEHTVALVLPPSMEASRFFELLEAIEEAEGTSVDLSVEGENAALLSLPVQLGRGEALHRSSSDRRAVVAMSENGIQLGTADDLWTEVQLEGDDLPTTRLREALLEHVSGRGNPACILSVRPDVTLSHVARCLSFFATLPRSAREDARQGWMVWLDPEDPPAPAPVANTAADAVANHRVRLRQCYERYLRGGGTARGTVVLEINLGTEGEVSTVRIGSSELGSQPSLDQCLLSEARRIRFPPHTDAPMVRVPLRFVPR